MKISKVISRSFQGQSHLFQGQIGIQKWGFKEDQVYIRKTLTNQVTFIQGHFKVIYFKVIHDISRSLKNFSRFFQGHLGHFQGHF